MASSDHQQPSVNPNTGYCYETKTFHSIHPTIPLPFPTLPLTSASYAYSLYLSSSPSSSSFSSSHSVSTVPALIDSTTSLRISYSQFFDRVQILSSFLQTHFPFLTNGQIAFVLSPSTVHVPVLYFSLLSLGMVVSPSNPASTASEISRQIQLSSPVIAFAMSSTSHKLPSSLPTLLLDSPLFLSLFSTSSSSDAPRHRCHHLLGPTSVRQSDPAAILYSSGTTGNVKGVVLTHRNLMSVVAGMYAVREERAEPTVLLLTVPMFHAYGFVYCLKAAALGETVVVVEGRFEVGRMMKAVEQFGVTHVATAPPVVAAMAKREVAVRDRYAVRSLERIICGGAPLRRETMELFKARFPNVLLQQGYALTETTGAAFRMVGPEEISHLGSVGRLVPYCEAKIVDPGTGITLSPCRLGELWIRGPIIMKGYVGDESATAATINSDGWLKTGDLCYMDNDGFLFVVDRLKELIKYKGYQVPPAELEQLLLTHPEITEAAVIPYPDEEAGQVPMAFVVRRPNSNLNEAQIMEFVARLVAPYKKIRRVSFINSIPKNPSGKLLRKELVKIATSSSGSPSSRL
ncbi:hypothetical protein AAC387_Pa12g1186 [Persea americana]